MNYLYRRPSKHLFMKSTLFLITIILTSISFSQINEGGVPLSFKLNKQGQPISTEYNIHEIAKPNREAIASEDIENSQKNSPYRVAINIPVNLNINNSGTWTTLSNGDRIWRLGIKIEEAKALGIYFNRDVSIPKGGKLYAYNQNHSQHIGGYTNNTPSFTAMEMIEGELLTLEYYMPHHNTELPIIDIKSVAYYYRGVGDRLDFFANGRPVDQNRADACQVDVACSEITGWETERDAVVRYTFMIGNSTFLCSGSVINNTSNDCKPYIISANHCGEPTNSTDIDNHIWYFNYQRPTCSIGNTTPYNGALSETMSGGFFRASSALGTHLAADGTQVDGADFLLVELEQDIPQAYNPYYAGWNRGTASSSSGVSIHHPSGDEKKISTYTSSLISGTYNNGWSGAHWTVEWTATTNGHGVTEGGSSGAPIFNSNHEILGILSGGNSFCTNLDGTDLYGKFNRAWDQDGNSTSSQLKTWLDPTNSGANSIEGTYYPCNGGSGGSDDYCEASSENCDEYISNITFAGISNSTLCTNYELYWENSALNLTAGSAYMLELTTAVIGSASIGYEGDQIAVWIDWNRDGDFTDSGEEVLSHVVAAATSVMPLQTFVNVPANAVNGITRMRARVMYDLYTEGAITPCTTSNYGEVEDYTLKIDGGISSIVENSTSNSFQLYPNPSSGSFFIDLRTIDGSISSILILDAMGKQLQSISPSSELHNLNLTPYSKGIYFVAVTIEGQQIVKKIVLR